MSRVGDWFEILCFGSKYLYQVVVSYCLALSDAWSGWSFLREVALWSQLHGLWLDGDSLVWLMSLWIMAVNNV